MTCEKITSQIIIHDFSTIIGIYQRQFRIKISNLPFIIRVKRSIIDILIMRSNVNTDNDDESTDGYPQNLRLLLALKRVSFK